MQPSVWRWQHSYSVYILLVHQLKSFLQRVIACIMWHTDILSDGGTGVTVNSIHGKVLIVTCLKLFLAELATILF